MLFCFAGEKKKETKLGLSSSKAEDFGNWYSEVVVESEMISYYDVSGATYPFHSLHRLGFRVCCWTLLGRVATVSAIPKPVMLLLWSRGS